MTTTTKILLICSLAGACALALWPRAAAGARTPHDSKHAGLILAANSACALGEVAIWHNAQRFERDTPTVRKDCATRWS